MVAKAMSASIPIWVATVVFGFILTVGTGLVSYLWTGESDRTTRLENRTNDRFDRLETTVFQNQLIASEELNVISEELAVLATQVASIQSTQDLAVDTVAQQIKDLRELHYDLTNRYNQSMDILTRELPITIELEKADQ